MVVQVKDFHYPLPDCLAIENLFDGHTFNVFGFHAVQLANHVSKFVYRVHAVASTKSPTLQNPRSTPAAIAGVQRIVLCRFTKL